MYSIVDSLPFSNPRTFPSPQNETPFLLAIILNSLLHPDPGNTDLLPVPMGLLTVDTCSLSEVCKWNHAACGLWWLASFTSHNVSRVYPQLYCVPAPSLSVTEWKYHILFIHSPVDGHVGCFRFVAIMGNAVLYICVQVFEWTYVLQFSWAHLVELPGHW